MNYEEVVEAIKRAGTGHAARRRSWDDEEACIWWDGQQIQFSRFKSRGVGWTLTKADKQATDWITDELDSAAAARKLVMTDDPEEILRLEKLLECSQEEAVSSFIEGPAWTSLVPEFNGGKGTPEERRAALRAWAQTRW